MASKGRLSIVQPEAREFSDPDLFINRETSIIEFNYRVLQLARDPTVPLLERLRFLAIFSSNIDEFFEVRVAGLRERAQANLASPYPDASAPSALLRAISERCHQVIDEQYKVLNEELFPALATEGIRLLKRTELSKAQTKWLRKYFKREVMPVLSPMGLDPAHPFPNVTNKGLNIVVSLEGQDAFGRDCSLAVIPVPRCLPRLIQLPEPIADGPHHFVMLSSAIHSNVDLIFPSMKVTGCHQFRITRNSDMWVDEDEADDLLSAIKGELHGRNYGAAVRLEVADNCSSETIQFLSERHGLEPLEVYQVNGPVNLHRVSALVDLVDRPDLKFSPMTPSFQGSLGPEAEVFSAVSERDYLFHHPYESYAPVVALIAQAAIDPAVLAIKMTLYRTGMDSPIVRALINAARNGKQVTAVVELRARFDEAANIDLATRLQEAGASVAYGVVGYKCHAKMALVVRREEGRIRRYVHLGTGNYHSGTSRFYTDFSYMTADPVVGEDVHNVFQQLTSFGSVLPTQRILQAPFSLRHRLMALIDQEAQAAREGRPASIRAKLNALSDPAVISALYDASQAGVKISLIVRGICCLRPGLPGISENISVRSILGRFLEHARVYQFHADGDDLVYIASADWMDRNLRRRVEVAVPITEPALKRRVVREALDIPEVDNVNAWLLDSSGNYVRLQPSGDQAPVHVQTELILEHHP